MAFSYKVFVCLLTIFSRALSQFYGQYGYQPYYQYPAYNPGYVPYPYIPGQSYQPYVSTQSSYLPYYNSYPTQNYPVQNYPSQNFPTYFGNQPYGAAAQPSQAFYPAVYPGAEYGPNVYPSYSPANVGYTPVSQTLPTADISQNKTASDPYANIRTDIIDVEPQYFHYYKRFFNLEDNLYPIEVIDDDRSSGVRQASGSPSYIVQTDSKQINFTNVPHGIKKHDVQTKTFSFKKTFTIDPNKEENAVINLNFVNGVEVTTEKSNGTFRSISTDSANASAYASANASANATATTIPPVEELNLTTTESEEPVQISRWFG